MQIFAGAFMESQGKDIIQWSMRSGDKDMEEETNEEGNEEEKCDDDEAKKDDDTLYRNDFEDLFASTQPSIGGLIIRESIEQSKLPYKKSVVQGNGKGIARSTEVPKDDSD
ncbi:hypothetical protein J1N35_034625 [Gossypium stocksii]|uniref:Uncharacterized protein n=1 Tax=Gossypium stocksii TaxID=47602 RepID=A0A9D3ZQW3_9ROSI|nr:hypothetical protein J1N35_034625 [Gossypium stocksii]